MPLIPAYTTLDITAQIIAPTLSSTRAKKSVFLKPTPVTLGPSIMTILQDVNTDGTIQQSEYTYPLTVSFTIPTGAVVGDTWTVTVLQLHTVTGIYTHRNLRDGFVLVEIPFENVPVSE